ncbi:DUF3833 family protein [Aureimonas phyllosphaerae]|uniref:DUF3833 family protein n=1 Tax=Aureimonas phyllosphaerae TaxID=1166078 RepID=A0A7W6BSW6_9HYPH|nr:DUF3833 family protein [Aureimonas phyllosphaerae]MBB3934090.1 hypothetical protein [Aureimonas phyllosphaerae]MBB3958694.1 hypothetical protein [Aureimonas phyllosphaerae]SFF18065.1 Protein of unknown function [Aureimonas phyllosphaerae]
MRRRDLRGAALAASLALLALPARAADDFSLRSFFAGHSVSGGEIRTLGLFRERFTARFEGKAKGDALDLDERFRFQDGARLQRWHLVERGGRVTGTVETEDGWGVLQGPFPVSGTSGPGGAVLAYRGIAPGGGRWMFDFRHQITPRPDGTAGNRVRISRFGLPLAGARVTFTKSEAALAPHLAQP